ncbi:formate/nitrite transporter family protein [Bacillus sp. B1-b2]|uniref:formate/nitrite transporter family protein n=1 Tax=Bacillus sp. B1-b2 TaxID=2653201 RepID=UPI0012623E83|nr:formate/nitrite transporter family protein [Bacillus sp. B1-b2]KAB7665071.1 formate/nitrite transporter family protein [Bacillus sp. B1-b2]
MEGASLNEVEKLALKKLKIFKKSKFLLFMRAVLASMFIGFGVIVAFKTGNFFYSVGSPFAYPMGALVFGAAIILIAYGGGDLFTGNTFYYTYAALRKKIMWSDVFKVWGTSYAGNIVGAIFFAIFILLTGLFKSPSVNEFLLHAAEGKLEAPISELFFRGILCNWLVCLAFFIPMSMKENTAKIAVMVLLVFCFFISGYEHSIANMVTFSISYVLDQNPAVTIPAIIRNLIPVTLGNLVGGVGFMGFMYYYVNKPFLDEEEGK